MKTDYDIVVVGGGPVGLWLAIELGSRQRRVLVIDKRCAPPAYSMAIGITPPTLDALDRHGLADAFVNRGVRIAYVGVSEGTRFLGKLSFAAMTDRFRFILSLPQSDTVRLLREHVQHIPPIHALSGECFERFEERADHVTVWHKNEGSVNKTRSTAQYIVACDGIHSAVRQSAAIPFARTLHRPRFVMADFEDQTDWREEARLFFSRHGSIESFPLPGQRRRWVVRDLRTNPEQSHASYIRACVKCWAGLLLDSSRCFHESAFQPARGCAGVFARGRLALCGDAAHEMSPIGGQGMNTGLADAALLAELLDASIDDPAGAAARWRVYDRERRHAWRVAANRAARGMWLGTRTGLWASRLRGAFIKQVLLHRSMQPHVAAYFAMRTLPGPPVPLPSFTQAGAHT